MTPADLDLIAAAATDSDAFSELFERYKPLVNVQIRQYNIRGMAHEDWLQEARIAMLKAINHYDGSRGSQFGAYYRLVLASHFKSLMRHYLAQKRTADSTGRADLQDFDALDSALSAHQIEDGRIIRIEFGNFLIRLSPLEASAFNGLLHKPEQGLPRSLQRAGERSRAKLLDFIAELH